MECILVAAIMAIVFAAIAPLLHSATLSYNATDSRVGLAQEARFALAHAAASLRQARAVTAASDDGNGAAGLVFLADDGTTMVLSRAAGSGDLLFGPAASPARLSRNCGGLAIRCYQADGSALASPLTDPGAVASVEVALTVTDPDGRTPPLVFTTRATLARPRPTIVINEVMYKPPAAIGPKDKFQWVELHNTTSQPIDVAGWYLWTKKKDEIDTLEADTAHGGTSVIPAGGYAVVTDRDTALYGECLTNGGFESGFSGWGSDTYDKTVTSTDPVEGSKRAEIYWHTWARLWKYCDVPAGGSVAFSFWERRHPDTVGGQIFAQISGNGFSVTCYSGPASDDWTFHCVDAGIVAGASAKVYLKFCPSGTGGRGCYDAVSVVWSPVSASAAKLRVNDNAIGDDLEDEQVYLSQGQRVHDAVVFRKEWAGDGDGSTLSRTSPYAPATEQATWAPGPYGGTPGAAN